MKSSEEKKQIVNLAYERLKKGESLRSIAENLKVDRKTLRDWMDKQIPEKMKELKDLGILTVGAKSKGNVKRKTGKKKIDAEKLSEMIEELGRKGIRPEHVQDIFETMQKNQNTKIQETTFIQKLLEILNVAESRNQNIEKGQEGFISPGNIVSMIERNPKIMTIDTNRKLKMIMELIDDKASFSQEETNDIVKRYPKILTIGYDRLKLYMAMFERFEIGSSDNSENLLTYALNDRARAFTVNPSKLLRRLAYFAECGKRVIKFSDYQKMQRSTFIYGNITDEFLKNKYPLPEELTEEAVNKTLNKAFDNEIPI